jgi:hypothetical protein
VAEWPCKPLYASGVPRTPVSGGSARYGPHRAGNGALREADGPFGSAMQVDGRPALATVHKWITEDRPL